MCSPKLKAVVAWFHRNRHDASKRVVVWDTTLRKMTVDETLFVFGHEMGHYVLHHILLGIVSVCLLLVDVLLAFDPRAKSLLFALVHIVFGLVHHFSKPYADALLNQIESLCQLFLLLLALLLTATVALAKPMTSSATSWEGDFTLKKDNTPIQIKGFPTIILWEYELKSGSKGIAIGFSLLLLLLSVAAQMIPRVGAIGALLVGGALELGGIIFFLNYTRGGVPEIGMLFAGFKWFGNTLCTYLLVAVSHSCGCCC